MSTGHSHWHTYISSFIFIHFNKDNISLFSITAGIVGVFTAIVVASIRCHFLPLQSQYAYVITVTKNYARKLKDEQILPFDSSFAACNQVPPTAYKLLLRRNRLECKSNIREANLYLKLIET